MSKVPEAFFKAYLDCVVFTDTSCGEDECYGADFAPEALAAARADCEQFWHEAKDLIDAAELTPGMAGRDFWLTRNYHGAGFWDRGLGPIGDQLTKIAHAHGSREVYLGDDGQAYFA